MGYFNQERGIGLAAKRPTTQPPKNPIPPQLNLQNEGNKSIFMVYDLALVILEVLEIF
jgi:hypothetical protein